jgi:putative tricarboxylic transport membrane protein
MIEENLRRSMLLSNGNPMIFLTRPISLAFILVSVLLLVLMMMPAVRKRRGHIAG